MFFFGVFDPHVRWLYFLLFFFCMIACAFWEYVWFHRVDFVQVALEQMWPQKTVTIGSMTVHGAYSVQCTDIEVRDSEQKLVFTAPAVELASPPSEWLFWLLTPSTKPLHLTSLNIISPSSPLPSALPLTVDSLHSKEEHGQ